MNVWNKHAGFGDHDAEVNRTDIVESYDIRMAFDVIATLPFGARSVSVEISRQPNSDGTMAVRRHHLRWANYFSGGYTMYIMAITFPFS